MHVELRRFVCHFAGTVAMALIPVVFTAFVSLPFSLNRHPGEEVPAQMPPRHMT